MTAPYAPGINRLRRQLRGVPASCLVENLQEMLDGFPAAALAADNTGRWVAANGLATELTGFSRDELLRMSVADLTPAMRPDSLCGSWNRFIQVGAQSGDYVLHRKDGAPVAVHYAAYASVAPGMHVSVLTPAHVAPLV